MTMIPFPFDNYRPSQEEIISKTTQCLQKNERLMLSASSGLGKTIGTLFPALNYALEHNKRVFVVTSKTTQHQIYQETLQLFEKKGAKFNSIILTAKEKMCVNSSFICDKLFCPYLENYIKGAGNEVIPTILTHQVLNARYIRKLAKAHTVCPFELSLDCSLYCDIIVGDYNYVFHPYIKLKRFFEKEYDDIILIIDEAHNLHSRVLSYYSPEITAQSLTEISKYLRSLHLPPFVKKEGITVYRSLFNYILQLSKSVSFPLTHDPILQKFDKDFIRKVSKEHEHFISIYTKAYASQQGMTPSMKDKILLFGSNLQQFSLTLEECNTPEYSELLYIKERKLKLLCKSAAPKLEQQLAGFHSVIMQSATLFPFEYFQKILGYPSSSIKLQYNSPFTQHNRLYLVLPTLSTKYEDRQYSYDRIATIICNAVNVKKGNYLAFFPSFAYLKAVQQELETLPLSVDIIVQESYMNEYKRRIYLQKLKSFSHKYLLLCVHGGIFSEGVDFIGDMAIGTFIIGPGLPPYSVEQQIMKEYFDYKWKKGFEYAYRNPGMMKVIQAAGRIFRTSTDRGFVMLIGKRFITPYYNSVLPNDWNIEYPVDIIARIQEFWNQPLQEPKY